MMPTRTRIVLSIIVAIVPIVVVAWRVIGASDPERTAFDKIAGVVLYYDFASSKVVEGNLFIARPEDVSQLYDLLLHIPMKDISKREDGRNFLNGRIALLAKDTIHLVFYQDDSAVVVYDIVGHHRIVRDNKHVFHTAEYNSYDVILKWLRSHGYIDKNSAINPIEGR